MREKTAFEKAYSEVKNLIRVKDKKTKEYKYDIVVAKQEFLAEVKEKAEEWFDKKIKEMKIK